MRRFAKPVSIALGGSNPPPSALNYGGFMEINEFAKMSYERNKNNDPGNIYDWEFHLIGMSGECGELLNKLKKIKRGDFQLNKEEMAEEVADVITYALLLLSELGVDPEQTILSKFEKVNQRLASGGWHVRDHEIV